MPPSSVRSSHSPRQPLPARLRRWNRARPAALAHGELRRQQRYFQHQLEAETEKLDQFTRFVALIEQGASKDESGAAVLCERSDAAPAEQTASGDAPVEGRHEEMPSEEAPAEPRPRLEGQALRHALFATLARLFNPR